MKLIFNYLVFPGFLLSAVMGALISFVDRKVTARIQYRQGPPLLQPVYDIIKLFGKELIIPNNSNAFVFLLAPIVGFIGITIVSVMLGNTLVYGSSFIGDLIVVIYMLTLPSLAIIFGGFVSGNPFASLGASREIKLVLAYELPFIAAVMVPVIKAGGSVSIIDILSTQFRDGIFLASFSGAISFIICILCVQAKLGLVPFDMAEAETEIMGGALVEYSGPALGIYKLTKMVAMFVMPLFIVILFLGGIQFYGLKIIWGLLKIVFVVVLFTLIRNTNPRVRIDQAIRFFWGPVAVLGVIAVILAMLGY